MRYLFYFIFFFVSIVLVSCTKNRDSGNSIGISNDTTIHVSNIKFNDTAALLLPSLTEQLSVTITPADATNAKVNWKSSDASIVSVDTSGLITAVSEGSANIIAISAENGSIRDTINVYVRKNYDVYVVGINHPANYDRGGDGIFWKNGAASQLSGPIRPLQLLSQTMTCT